MVDERLVEHRRQARELGTCRTGRAPVPKEQVRESTPADQKRPLRFQVLEVSAERRQLQFGNSRERAKGDIEIEEYGGDHEHDEDVDESPPVSGNELHASLERPMAVDSVVVLDVIEH